MNEPAHSQTSSAALQQSYDSIANNYDELYEGSLAPAQNIVNYLEALTQGRGGRYLEVGVGTGRVALPLAARPNLHVYGLDPSAEMLGRLAAKDVQAAVHCQQGDVLSCQWDGNAFDVCYLVNNVIYHALSEAELENWFRRLVAMLAPGGHIVIENFVEEPPQGSTLKLDGIINGVVYLKATQNHPVTGVVDQVLLRIEQNGSIKPFPTRFRYYATDALDRVAAAAGLTLQSRHWGWRGREWREPGWCVSRYQVQAQ